MIYCLLRRLTSDKKNHQKSLRSNCMKKCFLIHVLFSCTKPKNSIRENSHAMNPQESYYLKIHDAPIDLYCFINERISAGERRRGMLIHKNREMTMLVGHNFFHQANDPVYPRPLIVRVGFQLSDLALL